MITLPTEDPAATETADDGSTRQQVQRIVDTHALEGERKHTIRRALFQRRVDDELQRVTGKAETPGARLSRQVRLLVLVGLAALLGFLLIDLLLPPM
jgi:hypothetical protein